MATEPAFLKLVNVCKNYGSVQDAPPVRALDQINLEIQPGSSTAILGPSGSGKSTLLNIIGALDRPTCGQVFFQGADLSGFDENQLAEFRNRRIGFVFQAHHLLPQCTVLENVLIPTLACNEPGWRKQTTQRACRLLERVGLAARK